VRPYTGTFCADSFGEDAAATQSISNNAGIALWVPETLNGEGMEVFFS
jgi:hypothetical protein